MFVFESNRDNMQEVQMVGGTEASRITGISRDMLAYYCKKGRGPAGAVQVAGRWVYDPEGLKGWKPQPLDRGRPRKSGR
jgi:hypothetical protein